MTSQKRAGHVLISRLPVARALLDKHKQKQNRRVSITAESVADAGRHSTKRSLLGGSAEARSWNIFASVDGKKLSGKQQRNPSPPKKSKRRRTRTQGSTELRTKRFFRSGSPCRDSALGAERSWTRTNPPSGMILSSSDVMIVEPVPRLP